jgi:hypothetical protein
MRFWSVAFRPAAVMLDLRRRVQGISKYILLGIGRKDGLHISCG